MWAVFWSFEIEHVELATRFEDAPDRAHGLPLFGCGDVVEHERGEHTVEGRLGIRKLIPKPLFEPDRDLCARRLATRARERIRVAIESNDVGLRIEAFSLNA